MQSRFSLRLAMVSWLTLDACRCIRDCTVADIGCDHGYLSIFLSGQEEIGKVIACDVRKGPLERARRNIAEAGLSDRIETRLADGLSGLGKGEADVAVLAGMGGRLMMRILEDGSASGLGLKELVLQPQSDIGRLRHFLRIRGFEIRDESIVIEYKHGQGRTEEEPPKIFYPAMRVAVPGDGSAHDIRRGESESLEDRYGPLLLAKRDPILLKYLKESAQKLKRIREGMPADVTVKSAEAVEAQLKEIEQILREW